MEARGNENGLAAIRGARRFQEHTPRRCARCVSGRAWRRGRWIFCCFWPTIRAGHGAGHLPVPAFKAGHCIPACGKPGARGVSGTAACAGRSPQVPACAAPSLHSPSFGEGPGAATILHAADCGRHAGGRSGGVPALHSYHGSQSRPHGGGVGKETGERRIRFFLES